MPLLCAVVVALLDQATKLAVLKNLPVGSFRPVVPCCFHLVHYRNTGAAWGMFEGNALPLAILSALILVAIAVRFRRLAEGRWEKALALGLVAGGTVGNLYDRLAYGEVVDFLLFFFRSFRWPAFNVADSAISLGIGIYVYSTLFVGGTGKRVEPQPPDGE
jgi:signal peptidase II